MRHYFFKLHKPKKREDERETRAGMIGKTLEKHRRNLLKAIKQVPLCITEIGAIQAVWAEKAAAEIVQRRHHAEDVQEIEDEKERKKKERAAKRAKKEAEKESAYDNKFLAGARAGPKDAPPPPKDYLDDSDSGATGDTEMEILSPFNRCNVDEDEDEYAVEDNSLNYDPYLRGDVDRPVNLS